MGVEIIRPSKNEWQKCQILEPQACRGIVSLENEADGVSKFSSGWRGRLDRIRQAVDNIVGSCPAFNFSHQKHDRKAKLEELPCQGLRRDIMIDKLGGKWEEHDYTIPVGRKYRK